MESILQSTPRLCRAIIFILILTGAVYFSVTNIFSNITSASDVSIEVNENGGLIFKASKKGSDVTEKYAQFMLPSNKVWINTGVDVGDDEECVFKITGNVHLAINHLVKNVEDDKIPVIKWTGPQGSLWENIGDLSDCADAKTKLLVKPGKQIGNVVGYFYKDGNLDDESFLNYFLSNRKFITKDVFDVGENTTRTNNSNSKARLFLCVNDILLDLTDSTQKKLSQAAFEGRKGEDNAAKWLPLLQQKEYYRLWFDDNVGGFLVNITLRKKKK